MSSSNNNYKTKAENKVIIKWKKIETPETKRFKGPVTMVKSDDAGIAWAVLSGF